MKGVTFNRAGNAIIWQALQHVGVKVIFLVRLLILARLLSPDDFGLLAVASIAVDVLMQVTDFGMIPALVQREEAGNQHYDAAWTVGVIRAFIVAGVTILAAPLFAQLFAEPRATDIIRYLALRPLIDSAASIKEAKLTRNLNFRSLAIMNLPKALANTMIAIVLAPWLGVWALVAGTLAGSTAYLILSYILAPYRPRLSLDFSAAHSLIRFGRWIFLTGLIAMAGQSLLRAVISRELGSTELGLYYLAASLAFLPADVASQVVGTVSFPFYARLQTDIQKARIAFRSILMSLVVLLFPTSALMIALAPSLVESVLGPKWDGTVLIIQILAIANVISLLGETIVPILKGTGHPDKILVLEVLQSSLLIIFVIGLVNRYGVVGAAMAWVPAFATSLIVGFVFLRQILPKPFASLGLPLASVVGVSTFVAIIAMSTTNVIDGLLGFLGASLLGITLTILMFLILERQFGLGLSNGFAKAFPKVAAFVGLSGGESIF